MLRHFFEFRIELLHMILGQREKTTCTHGCEALIRNRPYPKPPCAQPPFKKASGRDCETCFRNLALASAVLLAVVVLALRAFGLAGLGKPQTMESD